MDTTSNALSITLYLLARHPEVQEKLRQEILDAQHDGRDLGYDDLVSLPYLDAICRESLRLCVTSSEHLPRSFTDSMPLVYYIAMRLPPSVSESGFLRSS